MMDFILFFLDVYLFIREGECTEGGEMGGEGEKIPCRLLAECGAPCRAQSQSPETDVEITT